MKRHIAKDLNSRLKASSKQNNPTPTPTFQSRLQGIMEFELLPHKETIGEYILKLQRDTEQEHLLEESIESPIEESISEVNALSNLVQNLAVSYPNEFNRFSNFCKSFQQASLNKDQLQQTRILTEIASTFKTDPIRLEKWLINLSPQIESSNQSNNQDHINSNDTTPDMRVPVAKDINQIILPELISPKTESATKPLELLLSEIIVSNKAGVAELQTKYHQVTEYYKLWEDKGIQDIYNWAVDKKNKLIDQDISEAIAVMDRANQLITGGHRLRDTQVMATLIFVSNEEDKGKLCQIQTGEGKTTIASLVAVLKCQQGEKVDIITSNNILATEGASTKEDFYSLFGLTVATNNPVNPTTANLKEDLPACYKAEQELANGSSAFITTETLKARIKDSNLMDKALIPEHLEAYAAQQLDQWIDNALYAKYDCHENKQYIIKSKGDEGEKTVISVDYLNTGVNLNNTVWPHGLHQFLQLKHNLRLTTETLTSAHISNMHYIKKYGNKLFGMSGTLGSNAEKSLLSGIYNVEHNELPTYKAKRFTELPGLVVQDSNCLDSVVLEVLEQTSCNRSVLVICNTIQDVRIIKQSLELFNSLGSSSIKAIKTYIDEDDAEITKVKVDLQEVIIATNIAGRGSEVESLIAFYGSDSGELIEGLKIEEVKVARDLIEASRVEQGLSVSTLAQQKFTEFTEKARILIEGKKTSEDGVETDCSITERNIHNPYYSIKQAEYFLLKNDLRNNKLSMAKDALKHVSDLSKDTLDMLSGFYAKLFEVEIENNWYLMESFNKVFTTITQGKYVIPEPDPLVLNMDYKDAAGKALIKASDPLAKEINYLQEFFRSNSDYASILLAESSKDSNQDILRQSSLKASIIYGSNPVSYKEHDTLDNIYEVHNQVELQELLIRHQSTIDNSLMLSITGCISTQYRA